MINAHPLTWPDGWKRTPSHRRESGRFGKKERDRAFQPLSINDGVQRVLLELERIGVTRDDLVISTNVPTRMDGLPRSDKAAPSDPGVSVWWESKKGRRVMAIDRYSSVADNLAAIAATLEAMRAIERHGSAEVLERAYTGFTALEHDARSPKTRTWREILFPNGVPADVSLDLVKRHYRSLAAIAHPDKQGGSHEAMTELNTALAEAEKELQQ